MFIKDVKAREILDSRGMPTIEVDVLTQDGHLGRASVPSGASTGIYEAYELRDLDHQRYDGKGVSKAVHYANNEMKDAIIGMNVTYQRHIDQVLNRLDGTLNKKRLGANAILAISLAVSRAASQAMHMPLYHYLGGHLCHQLPVPMMNVINGGKHADNALDFQEFMIVPVGFDTFKEALRAGDETFHALKKLLAAQHKSINVGDEGGFAPEFSTNEEALDTLVEAIQKAGYQPGKDIYIAMDVASSELYHDGVYNIANKAYRSEELIDYYQNLISTYPIISIEDGLDQDDEDGWIQLTSRLGKKVQLVGDDLFVTNVERLKHGIQQHMGNAILIKPNQIGTLSETVDAIMWAKEHQYATIISHRSGETEDTYISDLAVAFNAKQIKTGSLSRSDRLAKYNQLLRIEEALDESCYAGYDAFYHLKK